MGTSSGPDLAFASMQHVNACSAHIRNGKCVLRIPQHSKPGDYQVQVYIRDACGTQSAYSSEDLKQMGFGSSTIHVQSSMPDTEPPVLESFVVERAYANLGKGEPAIVTCALKAADRGSGIAGVTVQLCRDDTVVAFGCVKGLDTPVQNIQSSCALRIPVTVAGGRYHYRVLLRDACGNRSVYNSKALRKIGCASPVVRVAQRTRKEADAHHLTTQCPLADKETPHALFAATNISVTADSTLTERVLQPLRSQWEEYFHLLTFSQLVSRTAQSSEKTVNKAVPWGRVAAVALFVVMLYASLSGT